MSRQTINGERLVEEVRRYVAPIRPAAAEALAKIDEARAEVVAAHAAASETSAAIQPAPQQDAIVPVALPPPVVTSKPEYAKPAPEKRPEDLLMARLDDEQAQLDKDIAAIDAMIVELTAQVADKRERRTKLVTARRAMRVALLALNGESEASPPPSSRPVVVAREVEHAPNLGADGKAVRDAILVVLLDAGKPLTTTEIRDGLGKGGFDLSKHSSSFLNNNLRGMLRAGVIKQTHGPTGAHGGQPIAIWEAVR